MTRIVPDFALSFLSHDWAGLILAAVAAALAVAGIRAARTRGAKWAAGLCYAVLGIAVLAALGAAYHVVHIARVRAQYPPPGKLVDIGGYRLHLLAEGEARGKPSIVWIGGGHSPGYSMHHLHRMLRADARSILIDRPGTGWSDIGPYPRSTAREAVELIAALDKAGERGPFVIVGYSFGGPLAANIARRYPDRVAGLVMMDGTPPDTIIYTAPSPGLLSAPRGAFKSGFKRLFGIHEPYRDDQMEKLLGAEIFFASMAALETSARSGMAGASILTELTPHGLAAVAWDTVVYDGDLGELPVYLLAPRDLLEFDILAQSIAAQSRDEGSAQDIDLKRLHRFYLRSRERYMAMSSRSERIYTPEGTHHVFGYETPEFVAEVVRRMLREHSPRAPAQPDRGAVSHGDESLDGGDSAEGSRANDV